MEFGNTFIVLFGFKVFEPLVIVTNIIFFTLCAVYFKRLKQFHQVYADQMAWFMLFLGTSSLFGAAGHSMQMQLGDVFFKTVLFMMNALSLFSIYFCFLSAYTFLNRDKELDRKYIYAVRIWVLVLLVASALQGNFTIIKIHAGIVLLFSMIAHYIVYRRSDDKGSSLVVTGILISFLPIIIHTLKISIDEWFNYKDISHVIMIISLIVIYKGASMSSEKMPRVQVTN